MSAALPIVALDDVTLIREGSATFSGATWTIRRGEQWAVVGPNGAGKSALLAAIKGQALISHGDISYARGIDPIDPAGGIASITFQLQRLFTEQEDSAYQSRWYQGLETTTLTARDILARAPDATASKIRTVARLVGIERLLGQQALHLSNGEMRRTLVARALLCRPRLLLLDEPLIGLDVAARKAFRATLETLMKKGVSIVIFSSRLSDLPRGITHFLFVRNNRVVGECRSASRTKHNLERRTFPSAGRRGVMPISASRSMGPRRPHDETPPVAVLRSINIDGGGRRILDAIDWTVRAGECWAVTGPNGSGKTTLLSVILGDHPQAFAQDVELFGRARGDWRLVDLKSRIGWASPDLLLHYGGHTTVLELVCTGYANTMGLYINCTRKQRDRALRWLSFFGLEPHRDEPFRLLSEGQQRLALLARALVKNPRLLVLDEPCQGLDDLNRARVLRALEAVCGRYRTTLIYVTHFAEERPRCMTHSLKLHAGRIVECVPLMR